jgi:uncharacterized protein YjiS (DUF1127 family)
MSKLTNQTYRGSLFHEVFEHHAKTGRELRAQALRRLVRGIVGIIAQGAEALRRSDRRRVGYRELMALDDRLLRDIGLHRDQIPAAVKGLLRNESNPVAKPQAYVATVAGRPSDAANDDRPDLAA